MSIIDDTDIEVLRPPLAIAPAMVMAYTVGAADSTLSVARTLMYATRSVVDGAGAPPDMAPISSALEAYRQTVDNSDCLSAEAHWCARNLALTISAWRDNREDDEFCSVQGRLWGQMQAWTVIGADPEISETIVAAARIVAESAHFLPRDLQQSEAAAAVVAAWSALAAGLAGVGVGGDVLAHTHEAAKQMLTINRLAAKDRSAPAVADADPLGPPDGIVVLKTVGGTSKTSAGRDAAKEFEAIAGKRLPRVPTPDLRAVRDRLLEEFPYAERVICTMLTDLAPLRFVRFRPTVLCGPAGAGKSRFARRLAEECGVHLSRWDCSASFDSAIGGTPRRWSTGESCWPLTAIKTSMQGNPLIMLDELDKAGGDQSHNGRLDMALLPMLEPETARAYPDPYVQAPDGVDLSWVSWIATANDDAKIARTLIDRFRVLRLPQPRSEHLPAIATAIARDLVAEQGFDPRWATPPLDGDELEMAAKLWAGGSLRRLRAVISRLLAHREAAARLH